MTAKAQRFIGGIIFAIAAMVALILLVLAAGRIGRKIIPLGWLHLLTPTLSITAICGLLYRNEDAGLREFLTGFILQLSYFISIILLTIIYFAWHTIDHLALPMLSVQGFFIMLLFGFYHLEPFWMRLIRYIIGFMGFVIVLVYGIHNILIYEEPEEIDIFIRLLQSFCG